jgi:hypothetical protein
MAVVAALSVLWWPRAEPEGPGSAGSNEEEKITLVGPDVKPRFLLAVGEKDKQAETNPDGSVTLKADNLTLAEFREKPPWPRFAIELEARDDGWDPLGHAGIYVAHRGDSTLQRFCGVCFDACHPSPSWPGLFLFRWCALTPDLVDRTVAASRPLPARTANAQPGPKPWTLKFHVAPPKLRYYVDDIEVDDVDVSRPVGPPTQADQDRRVPPGALAGGGLGVYAYKRKLTILRLTIKPAD